MKNLNKNTAIKAAYITGGATILAAFIGVYYNFWKDNQSTNTEKTPTEIPTPSTSKIHPNTSLNKNLERCIEEVKGFNENQCKKVLQTLKNEFHEIDSLPHISWISSNVYNCGNVKKIIEAEFSINNKIVDAEFSLEGDLLEIEYEIIPINELPEKIKTSLHNYLHDDNGKLKKKYQIPKSYELEKDAKTGKFSYEIEVNKETDQDVTFDEDGKKIKNYCED